MISMKRDDRFGRNYFNRMAVSLRKQPKMTVVYLKIWQTSYGDLPYIPITFSAALATQDTSASCSLLILLSG